jgi:hypothetical protein
MASKRIIQYDTETTPSGVNDFVVVDQLNGTYRKVSLTEVANTGGIVQSVNGKIGAVVLSLDDIADGVSRKAVTTAEKNAIALIKIDQGINTFLAGDGQYRQPNIINAVNIGTGEGIFSSIVSSNIELKSLQDGSLLSFNSSSTEITLDDSAMINLIENNLVEAFEYTDQKIYEFGTSGLAGGGPADGGEADYAEVSGFACTVAFIDGGDPNDPYYTCAGGSGTNGDINMIFADYAINAGTAGYAIQSGYAFDSLHSATSDVATLANNSTNLNGQNSSYYLDRTNHTGSQNTSTISNFDTATDARIALKVSGTSNKLAKFTASSIVGDSNITDDGTTITFGTAVTAGNIQFVQANSPFQTLTYSSTVNWNMNNGPFSKLTLAGNPTMAAPTNLKNGATYTMWLYQDGTGNRTVTWDNVFKWKNFTAPTLSTAPSSMDVLTFISDGSILVGTLGNNFGS